MITVIISGGPATGEPGPKAADLPTIFERFRQAVQEVTRQAEALEQVTRELLAVLPKFRPPVESGWPLPIPESPRTEATGRSGRAPTILEICQRYPAGFG